MFGISMNADKVLILACYATVHVCSGENGKVSVT